MADIKQAAKWMEEGKRVRRPYLDDSISIGISPQPNGWIAVFENGKRARDFRLSSFNPDDLLAEDWEIAH